MHLVFETIFRFHFEFVFAESSVMLAIKFFGFANLTKTASVSFFVQNLMRINRNFTNSIIFDNSCKLRYTLWEFSNFD